jgi:hypothetical protein
VPVRRLIAVLAVIAAVPGAMALGACGTGPSDGTGGSGSGSVDDGRALETALIGARIPSEGAGLTSSDVPGGNPTSGDETTGSGSGDDTSIAGATGRATNVLEPAQLDQAPAPAPVIDVASPSETPVTPPARVLFVGDSMMGEVATATAAALSASRSTDSVGYLLQVGVLRLGDDWQTRWATELEERQPDVIAVMVGPWELSDTTRADGTAWRLGDPGFLDWYRTELEAWVDTLTSTGARVLWLGIPPVRDETLAAPLSTLDAEFRALADDRPDVDYLDTGAALGSLSGEYVEVDSASAVRLRMTDGLHLCPEGAARIAEAVASQLVVGPLDPERAWRDGAWQIDADRFEPANCPAVAQA